MQEFKYDALVFIARLQPLHNGHISVIDTAMKLSKKVIIIVGSADSASTSRNPFSFDDRYSMLWNHYGKLIGDKLLIDFIPDTLYDNNQWVKNVYKCVDRQLGTYSNDKIGLIGHSKDHTSFYLKLFPLWDSIDCAGYIEDFDKKLLNATDIREDYFSLYSNNDYLNQVVPEGVYSVLQNYRSSENYKYVQDEMLYNINVSKQFSGYPYPKSLNIQTADAVVTQAGHVLLVTRGKMPGKNRLALPGGHVENDETIEEAVLRELNEETAIDVPPAVLKSRIKASRRFDHPNRSTTYRIITEAFLIDLDSEIDRKSKTSKKGMSLGMTKVTAGDDASNAKWYNIADLKRSNMHDDHFDIIQEMLKLKGK